MAPNTGSCSAEEGPSVQKERVSAHSEKQHETISRNDGKQTNFAGLSCRPTLLPIITCSSSSELKSIQSVENSSSNNSNISTDTGLCCTGEEQCTTPKAKEYRIPEFLPCPPAPRKPRVSSRFLAVPLTGFFIPPDLDIMFPLHKISVNI